MTQLVNRSALGTAMLIRGGFLLLVALGCCGAAAPYVLDDTGGLGRVFDGIGGLSGGGVSCSQEN